MSNYIIEKNVPIPSRRGGDHVYPFALMQVGDSFKIEKKDQGRVSASAWVYAKRASERGEKVRFITRKVDADTYRIWRVEAE